MQPRWRRSSALEHSLNAAVVPAESFIGGGSAPFQPIPDRGRRRLAPVSDSLGSEADLARALRQGDPPRRDPRPEGACPPRLEDGARRKTRLLLDAVRKVCHDRSTQATSNGPPLPG